MSIFEFSSLGQSIVRRTFGGGSVELNFPDEPDAKKPGLRVCHLLNSGRHFGPALASSVDLCTRDLVAASSHSDTSAVLTSRVDLPFSHVRIAQFDVSTWQRTQGRAAAASCWLRCYRPDIVVVQEHLPTASAVAAQLPGIPVVLQTHTFQKYRRSEANLLDRVCRSFKVARYRNLAGIIHVSEACAAHFRKGWSDVNLKQIVIPNGLDFRLWRPEPLRSKEILFVGRSAPEKGALEAAEGIAAALQSRPDWRAIFVLAKPSCNLRYVSSVSETLRSLGSRATVYSDLPHRSVKRLFERATVVVVPSIWQEPFGRTALEAHAGGATLVSSGTGGLGEVSGDGALYLEAVTAHHIRAAVDRLIDNPDYALQIAATGREWAQARFHIPDVSRKLDHWLEQIVADYQCAKRTLRPSVWTGRTTSGQEEVGPGAIP